MLTLQDPLAQVEVRIAVTVFPSDMPRAERPILVALGIEDEAPLLQTGTLGDLAALLERAWNTFQVPTAPTPAPTTPSLSPTPTTTAAPISPESSPPQQGMLDLF